MAENGDPHDFLARFLRGDLSEFFALEAGDTASALELPRDVDRPALVSALRRLALRLGAPAAVLANLDRLAHPASRVVVTGQQTGLLLGPMFTLSKAVSAIGLARRLDREDRPVVPLFWLASQDHDHAEIDHAYLLDLDEVLHRLEVGLPPDTPSGRVQLLSEWVASLLAEIDGAAFPRAHVETVGRLLAGSAARADTFADWFGAQLYDLLGDRGLVLVDPLDAGIAELFQDVLRREIEDPQASVEAVGDAGERLRSIGETPQLGRGADATNLFFERRDGGAARRVALRRRGGAFDAEGLRLTRADLLAALEDDPTRVTPAAALRPVTQDRFLPTVATVVGPGELRYFAQLRGVFRIHGVAMSLIWPRAEATMIEPPVRRILARYGLGAEAFASDPAGALRRTLLERAGHAAAFERTLARLEDEVLELIASVQGIDPTLAGAVERAQGYLERSLGRLERKSGEALARQDDITSRQFGRLAAHLLPLGRPQERVVSPYSLFLKFGIDPVLELFMSLPSEGRHLLELV